MRKKSERKPKEPKSSPEKLRKSSRSSRRRKKSTSSEADSDAAEVEVSDEEVLPVRKSRTRSNNTESENEKPAEVGGSTRSSKRRGQAPAAAAEVKTAAPTAEPEVPEDTQEQVVTKNSEVEVPEAAQAESTNGMESTADEPSANQRSSVESSQSPVQMPQRVDEDVSKEVEGDGVNENGEDSSSIVQDSKVNESASADDDDVVQINAEPENLESNETKVPHLHRSESPELNYSPDRDTDLGKADDGRHAKDKRSDSDSENSDAGSGGKKIVLSSVSQVDSSKQKRVFDGSSGGKRKGKAAEEGEGRADEDRPSKRDDKDGSDIEELRDLTQDDDIQELAEVVTKTSAAPLPREQRKRRWGTCHAAKVETPVVISSDYLKTIIPDVKPIAEDELNFSDTKSTADEEEEGEIKTPREASDDELICDQTVILDDEKPAKKKDKDRGDGKRSDKGDKDAKSSEKSKKDLKESSETSAGEVNSRGKQVIRKISIVSEEAKKLARPPTPSKNVPSPILLITNLVRPFTILQLRELLQRTGKIKEGGFWIDAIKSKCIVEFENEDQAVETRHALHDVRWPVSNPKLLHVDFARKEDLIKAQASTVDSANRKVENLLSDPYSVKKAKGNAPVREWDVGKPSFPDEAILNDRSKGLRGYEDVKEERDRERERKDRVRDRDRDRERDRERDVERDRKNRKEKYRRSRSPGSLEPPVRRPRRKDDEAPAKLLDDLFCKTKTSPCIYWLPLSSEQIAVKEEQRRQNLEELEKQMAMNDREKARDIREIFRSDRERDKDRSSRRKDRSRERDSHRK